jgi:type IV pilus assembly protein PilW
MYAGKTQQGFSLMELMIGVSLSTILMSGIVQLMAGSVSAYRLQLGQSQIEESVRYARDVLVTHIAQAGFQAEPWLSPVTFHALTDESLNGSSSSADQLGLQRWSRTNCYGNNNPILDGEGQPAFFMLQTRFKVNTSNNLAITCRYGPDTSALRTQINNFGLIEDVESMQVLYGEDRNGDAIADAWVPAQTWSQESNIRAVKVALLLSTRQAFDQAASTQLTLLDETITTAADGHLRRIRSFTTAIRGRLR